MHLLKAADSPIRFITVTRIILTTFSVSSTTSSSPTPDDFIFSSQDLILPNDYSQSLSLDSTSPDSSIAFSDLGEDEAEEPLMSLFSNDDLQFSADAFGADSDQDPDPDIDLLSLDPLETDCQSSTDSQVDLATADLFSSSSSSSSLWTRDESTTCSNPTGHQQPQPQLDIPASPDLFQPLNIWMPKKPPETDLDLNQGIRLPPLSRKAGDDGEGCFFPHSVRCCCDGLRAFSGLTVGGLVRVVTIEGCTLGKRPFPLLSHCFVLSFFHSFGMFPLATAPAKMMSLSSFIIFAISLQLFNQRFDHIFCFKKKDFYQRKCFRKAKHNSLKKT